MRILLFGGTTEGRQLAAALAGQGHDVAVCVATELGAEELRGIPGITVHTGRLPAEGILPLLAGRDLCVDATHPYAEHITHTLRKLCLAEGIPLRRVLRAPGEVDNLRAFPSQEAAAAFLAGKEGAVLLTTGAKELRAWGALDPARLFVRILPAREALEACEAAGIPHRNIIAMQGPFSTELNTALLRQYRIRFLVTKDGGAAGGFPEKQEAARLAGAELILIARPEEDGISPEELLAELMESSAETIRKEART